nr:hypothetical protein TetV2_00504 [Oceanusvirus sp.]
MLTNAWIILRACLLQVTMLDMSKEIYEYGYDSVDDEGNWDGDYSYGLSCHLMELEEYYEDTLSLTMLVSGVPQHVVDMFGEYSTLGYDLIDFYIMSARLSMDILELEENLGLLTACDADLKREMETDLGFLHNERDAVIARMDQGMARAIFGELQR